MAWLYHGEALTSPPAGSVGYVYLITDLRSGKQYIGKKCFYSRTSKRAPGKTRKTWTVKQSNWRDYFGSCDELKAQVKAAGPENYRREILHICQNKREMSYQETREQFVRDVLHAQLPDGQRAFYNGNIASRWFPERRAE